MLACRPTIDQLRQHPWVVRDYVMAQPRDPVPKSGTDNDLFEPTVDPKALSKVCFNLHNREHMPS